MTDVSLRTNRLLLRPWRPDDLPVFATMNADPRVMEFMPKVLTREESDAFVTRIQDHFARNGFGLWAVEVQNLAPFIGFVGLNIPTFTAAFTPCVEVGWRLAYEHWGRGYATEAARAAVDFGFNTVGLKEIVAMTVPANQRSQGVMKRLGMTYSPADDFDHPSLALDHPLLRHILYRLSRERWLAALADKIMPHY